MSLLLVAVLVIGTLVVALWWFATGGARQRERDHIEARRREQQAHARRVRRQAEARMNTLVSNAMQQMTQAMAQHPIFCQCTRCTGTRSSNS